MYLKVFIYIYKFQIIIYSKLEIKIQQDTKLSKFSEIKINITAILRLQNIKMKYRTLLLKMNQQTIKLCTFVYVLYRNDVLLNGIKNISPCLF